MNENDILLKTPIFTVGYGQPVSTGRGGGFKPVQVNSPDWVTVVVEKGGMFLMERQLRYGLMRTFEEFPCGMVEPGEDPVVAAVRELKEETGITVNETDLDYYGKFAANPAFMTNYMHYFYVDLDKIDWHEGDVRFDEHEQITSDWKIKEDAFETYLHSEGSSIMGTAWLLLKKNGVIR